MNKSFVALAVIALVLGISLGGAFVGGSIYGQSAASVSTGAAVPLGGGPEFGEAQLGGQSQASYVFQGSQSGNAPDAQSRGRTNSLDAGGAPAAGSGDNANNAAGPAPGTRSETPSAADTPSGGDAAPGRRPGQDVAARGGGLTGVIEKIEDGTLTIKTANGPVTVTMSEGTRVVTLSAAEAADLEVGATATAFGRRGEGSVSAVAVIINPSGVDISIPGLLSRGQSAAGQVRLDTGQHKAAPNDDDSSDDDRNDDDRDDDDRNDNDRDDDDQK